MHYAFALKITQVLESNMSISFMKFLIFLTKGTFVLYRFQKFIQITGSYFGFCLDTCMFIYRKFASFRIESALFILTDFD